MTGVVAPEESPKMRGPQTFNQISCVSNPAYRIDWVCSKLGSVMQSRSKPLTLLDVGAGTGPYRQAAIGLGYQYKAHDFGSYIPDKNNTPGMHNPTWEYTSLDYRCDILDIPLEAASDVVLCSEVLEHVPDPVASFKKVASLVSFDGDLILTVPLLSLMHQSPHWHASGLSPFFFEYWCAAFGLEVRELSVHGDYADLVKQEIEKSLAAILHRPFNGRIHRRVLAPIFSAYAELLRRLASQDLLSSGGIGVTLHATRSHLPRAENNKDFGPVGP